MPFRTVYTHPIRIETSVGVVTGELWSDRLIGIGLESPTGEALADADAFVDDARDLRELLARVGIPNDEAGVVATRTWAEEIGPTLARWERSAEG